MEDDEYKNLKTSDIIAEALIDWNIDVVFGLPGDGINGFIEALRIRQNKIKFVIKYLFIIAFYRKISKLLAEVFHLYISIFSELSPIQRIFFLAMDECRYIFHDL